MKLYPIERWLRTGGVILASVSFLNALTYGFAALSTPMIGAGFSIGLETFLHTLQSCWAAIMDGAVLYAGGVMLGLLKRRQKDGAHDGLANCLTIAAWGPWLMGLVLMVYELCFLVYNFFVLGQFDRYPPQAGFLWGLHYTVLPLSSGLDGLMIGIALIGGAQAIMLLRGMKQQTAA